jgi:hypothetical protein
MICIDCVTPEPLKRLIAHHGTPGTCQYCNNQRTAAEAEIIFGYIYERVRENIAAEDDLSSMEHGLLYECGADDIPVQTIDVVLSEWFELGDEPYFEDLWKNVPADFNVNSRGRETHFYLDDGLLERNFYEDRWVEFIEDISHAHRFFNPKAREFLDAVFSFLLVDGNELKPQCLRVVLRGEELFRARKVDGIKDARQIFENPAREFGPAPKARTSSQRMTPSGISALYCASERETCLSEIRSITGDNVVSVALTPATELKLLDLTQLERVEPPKLTLLDERYLDVKHLKTFANSLVKKMSKPKGRNDELSYLSTQVVFEYLRLRFGSQVDGLVIPSVQTGEIGTNVVLFPEASVVSAKEYNKPNEMETAFGDKLAEDFEPEAKLAAVAGSIRFHKVLAIETKAKEYARVSDLFMDDDVRKRLGLLFT